MARSRYEIFENVYPYFLTNTVVGWLPIFAHPNFAEIVLESWRWLQRERALELYGYVILENHLHWIAAAPDLRTLVGQFKSYTARCVIDALVRSGFRTLLGELQYFKKRHKLSQIHQLWQEGSHPQQVVNVQILRQKLDYLHANPVRRGYVDDPTHWRYSSARNYAGMPGLVEVVKDWG